MLTGRRAFRDDSKLATLSAILKQDPAPIPGAPRDLEKLLARCLRKEPERRAQHMGDVKLALEELKEESESGMLAGPAGAPAKAKRGWLWPLLAALLAISIGAVVYLARHTDRNDAAPLVSVPLTSFPGSEDDPTLSPDGNQVAFMWNGENRDNPDIYVKMVTGGPPLRLTTNPAKDYAPAWSPDGSQIAFLRSEGTSDFKESIILISPLRGPERKFTEITSNIRGSYIAWTPDSKSIAAVDRSSPQEPPSIYLYSLSAGERRRLTTPPAGSFGDLNFAFSRDGKWLAFARFPTSTSSDLLLLPMPPGGEPKLLMSGAGAIAWSPTGEEIIFGRGRLLRLAPFSSNVRPKPIEGAGGGSLTISRSGRLVYVRRSGDTNLWKMQGPGRRPVQVVASTRSESYPQVSPDGSRIAFSSDRSGAGEIWAADSDGSNPIQLTSLKGNSTHSPRWSPDGRSIVFSSQSNGNRDIYVMDASGGSLRRLTQDPAEEGRPIWSNDGKSIYFYSNRTGRQEIWKIALAGGAPVQVTQNGGHELQESPDGAYFYTSKGTMTKGLFRRSSAGGEETRILEKAASGWWAVSERGVIFASFDTDGPTSNPPISIQLWDAATGRIATIGTIVKPVQRIGAGLSATRNGQSIVWAQIDQEDSDLILVDNFR